MHSDISQPLHLPSGGNPDKDKLTEVQLHEIQRAKSQEIETWLLVESETFERRQKGIKILLLGQSESGKSAVLKNFQLANVPKPFDKDRSAWKIIVHLNVIASLKTILDVLEEEWDSQDTASDNEEDAQSALQSFRAMRLGLSPLFLIESNLLKLLTRDRYDRDCRSIAIRAGDDWKATLFSKHRLSAGTQVLSQEYDPTPILVAQRDDIISLWRDPKIQRILAKRGAWPRRSSGFFMDDIERVISPNFEPTDSDIIKARLRTIGIEEQHFSVEKRREGSSASNDFYIIDVAGARSQRHSWVPFFDDVQCILFLAPLAFNETLEEDRNINKIEDSFLLWKAVCKHKLLANIHIILFLNKKDVLEDALASGIQVKEFVPSYKERPNDVQSVTKYFRDRFKHFHKKCSPASRIFKCYETSAIDIKSMRALLCAVRDSMLRGMLTHSEML